MKIRVALFVAVTLAMALSQTVSAKNANPLTTHVQSQSAPGSIMPPPLCPLGDCGGSPAPNTNVVAQR